MPKGPEGQKRTVDAIGLAVMVGRIATGEIEDTGADPTKAHRRSTPSPATRTKRTSPGLTSSAPTSRSGWAAPASRA
jgi:hypothetical protein